MSEIKTITDALVNFRNERDWAQFHDTKNLATAISIEAAELNELFLWKTIKESEDVAIEKIKEELADVFAYAFLLAEKHQLDVQQIVLDGIALDLARQHADRAAVTDLQ